MTSVPSTVRAGLLTLALAVTAGLSAPGMASASVRVDDARLTSKQLTVRFQDGVVCKAPIDADGGMGMFVSCPHKARFDVVIDRPNWLSPLLGDLTAPYGKVRIIAEDGQAQTFLSPRSRDADYRREHLRN